MSVRLLLAAVVTLALLAGSIPAIEQANRARADQALADTTDRLSAAITSLERRSDPVPPGIPGARRRVEIDLPEGSTTARLTIDPKGVAPDINDSGAIRYRVSGSQTRVEPVDADIAVVGRAGQIVSRETPLVIREDTVVTLGYRFVDGESVVTVARG